MGTGGFLSSGMEYVLELNPDAVMRTYGQELNPESYAICKADMLIKGQEVNNIKLGNTLSSDQLVAEKFDYMLSNPPFGVDWKKISGEINDEHTQKGFDGRFGAGLPRVSDGSLLFLMHLLSKMRPITATEQEASNGQNSNQGSRIGIILNGSPLFTGGAGSGESEIRRYILEADLLEAIIALPNDMFYNTGIATYIWILSNKKAPERRGKVQLIDGSNLYSKMRKSLGSKRNEMNDDDIKTITRSFGNFEVVDARVLDKVDEVKSSRGRQSANLKIEAAKTFASKIFATHEFGYRRITIERPLRLSAQLSDSAIDSLRYAPKPFDMVMSALYEAFGSNWTTDNDSDSYGDLSVVTLEARAMIKADFSELKESQIKDVLDSKVWQLQLVLMNKAKALQAAIGASQFDDFNEFDKVFKQALKDTEVNLDISLDAKEKKQLMDAITWKNPDAAPVIKKAVKVANPLYGAFSYKAANSDKPAKIVEFQTDSDLRDYENVPLNPEVTTTELIESYFAREVQPHVPDAWINADKTDAIDEEVGIVGFEIPFNRHFYVYEPPRPLQEIDADLDAVSTEIMKLLGEVHS